MDCILPHQSCLQLRTRCCNCHPHSRNQGSTSTVQRQTAVPRLLLPASASKTNNVQYWLNSRLAIRTGTHTPRISHHLSTYGMLTHWGVHTTHGCWASTCPTHATGPDPAASARAIWLPSYFTWVSANMQAVQLRGAYGRTCYLHIEHYILDMMTWTLRMHAYVHSMHAYVHSLHAHAHSMHTHITCMQSQVPIHKHV